MARIVISRSGYNALTETDPTKLIFDSNLNSLKTVPNFLGSFQQVVNASSTVLVQFAHGLGYVPMVLAYYRDTADAKYRVVMTDPSNSANRKSGNINASLFVNSTNVYIRIRNSAGAQKTVEVFYEIFYEGV